MTTSIYAMSDTWNAAGTTFSSIKMDVTDTASQAASLLLDLQVGSAAKYQVRKDGTLTVGGAPFGMLSVQGGGTSQDNIDTTPILMNQWTNNGLSNAMTVDHTADTIVASVAGTYSVDCSFSFSGTNGATVTLEIYVYDNSGTSWSGSGFKMQRKLGSVDVGSSSLNGIVALDASDKVAIYISTGLATDDVTIVEAQMVVARIGD